MSAIDPIGQAEGGDEFRKFRIVQRALPDEEAGDFSVE